MLPRLLLLLFVALPLRAVDTAFLFTYFTGNGQDGLHLMWSDDGYTWQPIAEGRSVMPPRIGTTEVLMRDPCVVQGPDGTYHMVWTSGWHQNIIGHASTKDFIHWTPQQAIPVMAHEPEVRNSWAPEVVYDDQAQEFVIFWASTVPGRFMETAGASESEFNHRMYATTTKDWQTFTPTRVFYDPGFSVIDATQHKFDGQLYWIIKDETRYPPKKHLRVARAESRQGPFGELGEPFTPEGLWVEGPTAVTVDGAVLVYFDAYGDKHYGAMRSTDMVHWENVSERIKMPFEGTKERVRHGTIIEVPQSLIERLQTELK
ncbi:glycoside hydrolase family 43 protein [Actomonas aquatica]|uniref:Glycoside hydrolase family 43 protein n=1 Tax=Actomonas aquatica TaxID=2866162 RepID=A0ABZ1CH73_9BACT|nr:glycoside hydrolase family 43 protein [Opitutus sp. WL0086]WRQ89934.1 glycoside hydrolase family 43 protein [Opitutus sp. WL0086]